MRKHLLLRIVYLNADIHCQDSLLPERCLEIRLPGSGLERVRAVILSAAKDLCARRARPFAEFTLERSEGLRVTGILSKYLKRTEQ